MAKRIPISEPTVRRIRTSGPTVRRIDAEEVAAALGAEASSERIEGQPGPLTLYALRQELLHRRQSSGGRPGIEGTSLRAKIPLNAKDWQRLEALAVSLSAEGFAPSAGQVASVLLSIAVRSVTQDIESPNPGSPGYVALLARELAAQMTTEESR